MKNALIIFVRKPESGKVKTRIAATAGNEKALAIYCELLDHTRHVSSSVDADRFLFYAGEPDTSDQWSAVLFNKRKQVEGDLGQRMHAAFQELFGAGYERVVIIGSDCFELTPELIAKAFELLYENDVVIGPAADGGYYLLAMKAAQPFLFEDIAWSTDNVFAQTVALMAVRELKYALLPVLTDVDTEADYLRSKKLRS